MSMFFVESNCLLLAQRGAGGGGGGGIEIDHREKQGREAARALV